MHRGILILSFLISVSVLIPVEGTCCTSAIFSGKVTADGRPVIWKNRDSGSEHNRVVYIPAGEKVKYSFLYLSNSGTEPAEAWSGINSSGFSIMNTVSYNIRRPGDDTPEYKMDREGILMYEALSKCATLKEFEEMLDNLEAPFGLETNFGVIDASGGAAYYEVNNYSWIKYDVNESPEGYMIRTNYSFSGRNNQGKGYVRYDNASQIIRRHLNENNKIDVRFIMDGLSRSYWNYAFGFDPMIVGCSSFEDGYFIPRKSSVAVTIVQGVNPGEDTSECVFWCALGYPPTSVVVPMKVIGGDLVPEDMTGRGENNYAPSCEKSLSLKAEVFSTGQGVENQTFMDFNKLRSVLKEIRKEEDIIFDIFAPGFSREQLKRFYETFEI